MRACKVVFLLLRKESALYWQARSNVVVFHRSRCLHRFFSITRFYIFFEETTNIKESLSFSFGTNVANILTNSSNPTDPAEPANAAPTATSAQTVPAASASNEQSQGLRTAGPCALSVSPSKVTFQVSKTPHTACTLFSGLNYAYTRRNFFLPASARFMYGGRVLACILCFSYLRLV